MTDKCGHDWSETPAALGHSAAQTSNSKEEPAFSAPLTNSHKLPFFNCINFTKNKLVGW